MATVVIDVNVDAFDAMSAMDAFRTAIAGPSLMRFLEQDVDPWYRRNIEERFNEEGDLDSGFWPPLSDATVNIKKDIPNLAGAPEDPNVRTGSLRSFLVEGNYPTTGGADWAEIEIPGSANNPLLERKLRTAQQGSQSNPIPGFGPTPPRPVLATSEGQMAFVMESLESHIIRALVGGLIG